MPDRRYSDEEVRRIIALAAEAEVAAAAEPERPWSLGDIEKIGTEAGLAPQAVQAAAIALERPPRAEDARLLGMPVAVSRSVPLGRRLSDEDWDRLVGQLRETFAARGRVRVSGAQREWRVGNLRVTHEPAGSGAVLEMRTRKGDARSWLQMGFMLLVVALFAAVMATVAASPNGEAKRITVAWLAGLGGVLLLLVGLLRLPPWARRRAQQFDSLAAYARRIAAS